MSLKKKLVTTLVTASTLALFGLNAAGFAMPMANDNQDDHSKLPTNPPTIQSPKMPTPPTIQLPDNMKPPKNRIPGARGPELPFG